MREFDDTERGWLEGLDSRTACERWDETEADHCAACPFAACTDPPCRYQPATTEETKPDA